DEHHPGAERHEAVSHPSAAGQRRRSDGGKGLDARTPRLRAGPGPRWLFDVPARVHRGAFRVAIT
ncbi:MAG: hypothetical protein WAS75_15940, partial [Candidatus Microthrix subdominans]